MALTVSSFGVTFTVSSTMISSFAPGGAFFGTVTCTSEEGVLAVNVSPVFFPAGTVAWIVILGICSTAVVMIRKRPILVGSRI